MKDSTTLTAGWVSFAVVFVLMGWSLVFPVTAAGGWPRLWRLTLLSMVPRPSFAWAGVSSAKRIRAVGKT
jgi:hypothetical protein